MSTRSTISKKAAITDPDQGSGRARKRMTVPDFMASKGGEPLVCLTSYTAHVAHICGAVCDLLLVGDSLGMVIHGMPNTLGVTLEHMIMHGQAVVRGADKSLVVVDMPFGSFEESPEVAFRNASRVVKETGCHAVKLEGGVEMAPTIQYLSRRGIPVMAHIGLMPQSMNTMGGFKAVRDEAMWDRVVADAKGGGGGGSFLGGGRGGGGAPGRPDHGGGFDPDHRHRRLGAMRRADPGVRGYGRPDAPRADLRKALRYHGGNDARGGGAVRRRGAGAQFSGR